MALPNTILEPIKACYRTKVAARLFSSYRNSLLAGSYSPTGVLVDALADPPPYTNANPSRKRTQRDPPEGSIRMSQSLRSSVTAAQNLAAQRQQSSGPYDSAKALKKEARKRDLQTMSTRNWRGGDVYSPHDLSLVEIKRWKGKTRPEVDVFDTLALDPVGEWKNYAMMSEYTTSMGRIKHPRETGLRNVNQRRIAKAIRRAIGMGFLPSVHMHPEMLRRYDSNLA